MTRYVDEDENMWDETMTEQECIDRTKENEAGEVAKQDQKK